MGQQSIRTDGTDIVAVLRRDHVRIRTLLSATPASAGRPDVERWETFCQLSDLLVRHEVAEELVVYPELAGLAGGTAVRRSRLVDQSDIEVLLVALDRQEFGSPGFEADIVQLGLRVLAHLEREESQVLPLLATFVEPDRRTRLGLRYLESVAIVGPSPSATGVPSGPAVVDRTTAVSTFMRDSAGPSALVS